jgi:energy-converting hydrogenase Eha subunit E
MRRKPDTPEGRVARWAALSLSASMLAPICLVFGLLGFSYRPSSPGALLILVVAVYLGQIYFLDRIERYHAPARKRIWVVSLALHLPVIGLALVWATASSMAVLILFAPELVSAALHLRGIVLHDRQVRVA